MPDVNSAYRDGRIKTAPRTVHTGPLGIQSPYTHNALSIRTAFSKAEQFVIDAVYTFHVTEWPQASVCQLNPATDLSGPAYSTVLSQS